MNYGNIIYPKELIDDEGSYKQTKATYRKGIPFMTTRYEVRVRVKNETEELAEIVRFIKEHPEKSAEFRREKPKNNNKDYYHIVKCWDE